MTDVFISYASEDRVLAHKLANALEARGWSVWWDRKIIAGQTFDQMIEHELDTAISVVVLWSKFSISSEWVKNEAAVASERGALVPALIDNVKLPLEFRRKQTADLIGWNGDTSSGGFQALCEGIAAKTTMGSTVPHRSTVPPWPKFRRNRYWTFGVGAALAVAFGFLAYRLLNFAPQQERFSSRNEKTARASPVTRVAPSEAHGINNPLSLELGVLNKVTLDKNEEYYFQLSRPADKLKIFLDMRREDNKESNLQSILSVLDQDGGVIKDRAINFNEIDVGYRKTTSLSLKKPGRIGFKLQNRDAKANFWLTVLKETDAQFVPFFGEVVPQPLSLGEDKSGVLDANEYVYYIIPLSKGDYKAILDFSNSKREHTNLQGYLALLDADGGNQRGIILLNEVSVSYRKIVVFPVKKDEPLIIKILNKTKEVNYTVKIAENR